MTQVATAPTQLMVLVERSGLVSTSAQPIVEAFQPIYAQADTLLEEAKAIQVSDATQVTEIKKARAMRLTLKEVRVRADKVRKALKEDSLRVTQAIDLVARKLTEAIEPVEARLLDQEQFAERAEAARMAALKSSRETLLAPYLADFTGYDLGSMPEATFALLLTNIRTAHEAKIEAQRKADADLVAAEAAKAEEDRRIRADNDRIAKELKAAQDAARAEREKAEAAQCETVAQAQRDAAAAAATAKAERDAIEAKARKEREASEAAARAEREALEAQAAAERKAAAEKVEREAKARKAAEAAAADLLAACRAVLFSGVPGLDGSLLIPASTVVDVRNAVGKAAV